MENQLRVFKYAGSAVRTVIISGEPWFVAKDVCNVFGDTNYRRSIARLDDDEKGVSPVYTPGGQQSMTIVNEYGLYDLLFHMQPQRKQFMNEEVYNNRVKTLKEFKRWITHEVIPSIRKTGGYVANDELFINTYLPYVDEQTKMMFKSTLETVRKQNKLIEEQRKEIKEKEKIIHHKEDVIISLVDEVTLAEKRQIINRVVRNGGSRYADRWNALYREFENKYHINLMKRLNTYNKEHKPKLRNKLDYVDKVLNKIPELYEIAAKLYENDVKKLVEELYELNGK